MFCVYPLKWPVWQSLKNIDSIEEIKAVTSCSTHKIDNRRQIDKTQKYDNPDSKGKFDKSKL